MWAATQGCSLNEEKNARLATVAVTEGGDAKVDPAASETEVSLLIELVAVSRELSCQGMIFCCRCSGDCLHWL